MDAPNPSSQVTYANRTPLRIGSVGLKARDLSRLTDFYSQAIGLQLIDRDAKTARLGAGGVTLLELEVAPERDAGRSAHRRASITPRSCSRRAPISAAGWCMRRAIALRSAARPIIS